MKPLSVVNALLLVLIGLVATASCFLLLYLSQFAQFGQPYSQLPMIVISLLGLVFIGLFYPLIVRFRGAHSQLLPTALITLGLSAGLAWWLSTISVPSAAEGIDAIQGSLTYVLAPLIGMGVALILGHLSSHTGGLISAMTVYISCTLLANFTFDSFITVPNSLIPGWDGLISVGTLFFGITFTQRDRVHRFGRRWAYLMIGLAAVLNLILSSAIGTELRYIIASFVAIIIAEVADTEVYQSLIEKSWLTRVLASNSISIPLDTILVTTIAFWNAPDVTFRFLARVAITDIVLKAIVATLAAINILGNQRTPTPTAATT